MSNSYSPRKFHNKTPEEIQAIIGSLDCPYDFKRGSEWDLRCVNNVPTTQPRLKIGDWMDNPFFHQNARCVRITWDCDVPGWRYSVPGFSSPEGWPGDPRQKNVEYEYQPESESYRAIS